MPKKNIIPRPPVDYTQKFMDQYTRVLELNTEDVWSNIQFLQKFILPKYTTAEKVQITGRKKGQLVYDTTQGKVSVYNGTFWETYNRTLYLGTGVGAQAIQNHMEDAVNEGILCEIGPGTFPANAVVSYDNNNPPPNVILLGYVSGTATGKTLMMKGAGKWLTTIEGDYPTADIMFRFHAEAGETMGRFAISDMAFSVGSIESVRPILTLNGNVFADIKDFITYGSYDLSFGGGIGQTGQFQGTISDCEFHWSSGHGINLGAGIPAGTPYSETNHPFQMRITRCLVDCSVSHAINLHGNMQGEVSYNTLFHDIARFGFLRSNAALRGGNTGRGVRWLNNQVWGYYRGAQMNDVWDAVFSNNILEQCGSPGFVLGAKNSGNCGNIILVGNVFRDVARLLGRPQPGADAEDPNDTGTIGSEATGILITGGESVTVGANTIESDYRRLGYGTVTSTLGDDEIIVIDNVNQGSQLGTGLSSNFPGDIIYEDDDADTPSFFGRIAVGGIGARDFMTGTDGTGSIMETIPYLDEPPDRVNQPYVIATVTNITAGATPVVTTALDHGFNTGARVWFLAVTGTMSAINNAWYTATKITSTTFSLSDFNSTGLVYGGGGTVQKGAGSTISTITLDAGAMATLTDEAYRVRWLEETTINTGVVIQAPSGGTPEIVPLMEPMYFVPSVEGVEIDVSTGTAAVSTVALTGNPDWESTIKTRLQDGSAVVLYGFDDGLLTGTKITLGVVLSVGSDTTLTLTSNGLRNYSGLFCFSIENKMRYGIIVGDQTPAENRARRVTVDWANQSIRGASIGPGHIYGECIAANNVPYVAATVLAQTITTPVDVLVIPPVLERGRQRMWRVIIQFKDAVAGDATDYVTATVSRDRGGTVTPTTGMIDIPLTDTSHLAGSRITIDGPSPVNDNIPNDDLYKVNERDLVIITFDPVNAGGNIPDVVITVEMLWW